MAKIKLKTAPLFIKIILVAFITLSTFLIFNTYYIGKYVMVTNDYMTEANVENFHYMEEFGNSLSDEDLTELKNDGINLEKTAFLEVDEGDKTFYMMEYNPDHEINKLVLLDGDVPTADNEVVLNFQYLKSNDLMVGDTITINDQDYTIVGSVFMPHFVTPVKDIETGAVVIDGNFGVAYANDIDSDVYYVAGQSSENPAVVKTEIQQYTSIENNIEFDFMTREQVTIQKMMDVSTGTYNFTTNGENERIQTFDTIASQINTILITVLISFLIGTFAVLIYYISYILKKSKHNIGIYKTLGYKNSTLRNYFLRSTFLITLIGLILGTISFYLFNNFLNEFLFNYLFVNYTINISWAMLIFGVLLLLTAIFVTMLLVNNYLKQEPILILKDIDVKPKIRQKSYQKPFLKIRVLNFLKPATYVIAVVGIFLTIALTLSAMLNVSYQDMINNAGAQSLKYDSAIYYDEILDDASVNDFTMLRTYIVGVTRDGEFEEVNDFMQLYGIDENTEYITLYNNQNEDITAEIANGVVINNSFAKKYDLQVGDSITYINPVNNEEIELAISGVDNIPWMMFGYTNRDYLNAEAGIEANQYTGTYSSLKTNDVVDSDNNIEFIEDKDAIVSTFVNSSNQFMQLIIFISTFIILLLVLLITFISFLEFEKNRYNMTIMKTLGYKNNKIKNTYLNIYGLMLFISVVIATIITYFIYVAITNGMIQDTNIAVPNQFNWWVHVIIIIFIMVVYYVAIYFTSLKIQHINIPESLKEK